VLNVVPEGPAEKAGIKMGDKIIAINGEEAVGKNVSNTYFSNKLRGTKGTDVSLKILRHNDHSIHDIKITRGNIAINTLTANYLINKNTAFVKINSFSRSTSLEFQIAAMQMSMEGVDQLIIDLRNNPGGLMIASIQLADFFLKDGELIVYTQGAHSPRTEYKATAGGQLENAKVVILIDENSASASEILAGALQDWDRALLVGRRSYGKGLVGRNYTLPDGSAIRLTTGHYYTPSGRCIQRSYDKGTADYNKDLAERYAHGELYSADSMSFNDSLKYYTNDKRLVYGGGAIMPDIFSPIDTSFNSNYLQQLLRYGVINYAAGLYFDENLEDLLAKYPDFESFEAKFYTNSDIINNINELAFSRNKIKGTDSEIEKSKAYILNNFKALLARNLYEDGAYFKIRNKLDKDVIKALEVINDKKAFKENGIHN
jgi:carboxyl-terminal processing protease